MHRILLFAMVVALLYFAWDSRSGETLAQERRVAATVAARPEGTFTRVSLAPADGLGASGLLLDGALSERLEARVAARIEALEGAGVAGDDGAGGVALELPGEADASAEVVLADAERWLESNFPEGGRTGEKVCAKPFPLDAADPRHGSASRELARTTEPGARATEETLAESSPIYVATLARIECLSGDLPAWCGLLDLSLRPPSTSGSPPFGAARSSDALGDTAWICDDTGKLLARVEALDGVGIELDPTWPWSLRQRRLFWAEGGATGMPVRQYRLFLEGSGFGPAWTGRLVLVPTPYRAR